jgi:hypothetical protein
MTTEQQSASSNTHWQLAGIRHHVFLKVFSVLRHNLLGPISVSRMNHSIMRRSLEKDVLDKGKTLARLSKIDLQLEEAVLGIRALSVWDEKNDAQALPEVIVGAGLKLMSGFLTLRNISVERLPQDSGVDYAVVRESPFLYAWLGLLCYIEDHAQQPIDLHIHFHDPRRLEIVITHPLYDVNAPRAVDAPHAIIDRTALQMLGDDADIQFEISPQSIKMSWLASNL